MLQCSLFLSLKFFVQAARYFLLCLYKHHRNLLISSIAIPDYMVYCVQMKCMSSQQARSVCQLNSLARTRFRRSSRTSTTSPVHQFPTWESAQLDHQMNSRVWFQVNIVIWYCTLLVHFACSNSISHGALYQLVLMVLHPFFSLETRDLLGSCLVGTPFKPKSTVLFSSDSCFACSRSQSSWFNWKSFLAMACTYSHWMIILVISITVDVDIMHIAL